MQISVLSEFLITCCLMASAVNGLGELFMIQEPERTGNHTAVALKYTCVSEDNLEALVWNYDLDCIESKDLRKDHPVKWENSAKWKFVNSSEHPMGPVLDSRWEGFAEMVFPGTNYHVLKMTASGSVVFSVRGYGRVEIHFCKNRSSGCLHLMIETYQSENKFFNKCEFVHPRDNGLPIKRRCTIISATQFRKTLIDEFKWKTVILQWGVQKIMVCNEFQCLFEIPLEEVSLQEKNMYIGMNNRGIIRFHFYKYYLATQENDALIWTKFHHHEQNLCIELTVSLCNGCGLRVYVVNDVGESHLIANITRTRYTKLQILPTWQVNKLNVTLRKNYKKVLKLKIATVLIEKNVEALWTVGNLRECKPVDIERYLVHRLPLLSQDLSHEFEPWNYCQKMSYNVKEKFRVTSYFVSPSENFQINEYYNISKVIQEHLRKHSLNWVQCPRDWWLRSSICDPWQCVCFEKYINNDVTVSPNDDESRHGTIFTEPPTLEDVNMRTTYQGNGVVILSLNFPEAFVKKNKTYQLTIELKSTRLRTGQSQISYPCSRNYTHNPYLIEYNHTLYLLASSEYLFSVHVVDHYRYNRTYSTIYRTPDSLGFKENEKLEVNQNETYIELELPPIVNDTLDSNIITVVKGSSTCASQKLPNMTESEQGWITSTFIFVDQPRCKVIIPIKQHPAAKDTSNDCSLRPGETYVIVVVVVAEKDNASAFTASLPIEITVKECTENSTSGWMISFFILAICFLLLFIWRRKLKAAVRQVRVQDLITYSQMLVNFIKSPIEQSATLGETSMNVTLSAIVSTCERVLPERSSSSTRISIKDFENYIKESIASELLKSQFAMVQKGFLRPCVYGSLPENKSKNRYADILPYDDTRVILKKNSGVSHSDYINANYVQGFLKKNAYIAAQGPKPQTVNDFWRMIWQEETLVICMLANVFESRKEKCAQYWPEFGASRMYGDVVVVTESHQVFADYTFRTFRVSCGQNTRKIEHMHYTGWPDHTVPWCTHPMISYLRKLLTIEIGEGPIVVHCSAGVGRTGTFILCDICFQQAAETGKVDVLTEFRKLRDCRLNMVDNETQYLFAHVVLAECFVSLPTKLPCDNALPQAIEVLKKQLPQHIQRLNDTAWQDQALRSISMTPMPLIPENVKKHRFPELAPVSNSLVYLKRYPRHDDNSYYINAIIVDGVRVKKQYLASQLPLPSTLSDFWRLVVEQEVQHIVVLQRPDPDDSTCCSIIADEHSFNPVPFINVKVKTSRKTGENSIIDELLLTDDSQGVVAKTQHVSMLTCSEWGLGKDGKPPPPKNLVDFWIASQNIRREQGPTLVLCHDGVTGCGLYLALSFLLEKMAVERECDIILAVQAIRRSRSEFVQSQEQFEYLYDAAAKYIEAFETYANFA